MNNNDKKKINIRNASKKSTRKECNNSEINDTEQIMNQLELLSFTDDKSFEDQTLFQKSRSNFKHGTKELINNYYLNIQPENQIPEEKVITNTNKNYKDNSNYKDKKEILQLKVDNILTTLRLSDNKINVKYYGFLFRFKDYFRDNLLLNYHSQFNDLFDLIIELLFVIKKDNEKNEGNNKNNKNGIILKLEKEVSYKDKQIGELLNKLKTEEQKIQKNSKDNNNELNALKKEIRELYYQISLYKNHIKKLDTNNMILEEKLNNIILEKINKRSLSMNNRNEHEIQTKSINMNNNININNYNGIISPTPPNLEIVKTNEPINNNKKINKEDNSIKKLNINLINLLKEINKIIGVYDLSLNKANIDDTQINVVTNINNMIDYNILNDSDKMENFHKTFLGNMDKILNKIDKLIENYKKNINKKGKELTKRSSPSNNIIRRNKKSNKKENNLLIKSTEKEIGKIIVNRKIFSGIKDRCMSHKNIKY